MSEFFAQLSGYSTPSNNYNTDKDESGEDFNNGYVDDNGDYISFGNTDKPKADENLSFEDVIDNKNIWNS